ncbi:MAG: GatB/YqeY domain-containing protein [Deltaproteobacteria bacterium]|nr:GatB/YqeY domain-containing protein [Deltaproteobacteria bacterium]
MDGDADSTYGWSQDMKTHLQDKLRADLKMALKSKDSALKDTVRLIMAEYPKLTVPITLESGKKTTRIKKPEEITNEEIIDIIRGLVKSEKTVLELKGEEVSDYLKILESYLPKMASKDEIKAWIRENINLSEFKNPNQAMGPIMKHFGKLADGASVKEILQTLNEDNA